MISVNLTTTSSRLELCSATVWSLIKQKTLPDKIVLWISKEAYLADEGIKDVPEWVEELNSIHNVIDVRFVENTGPYRKIMNALIEADSSDILIYADDDVIYGELWLNTLLKSFYKNKAERAIASRIRIVKRNILGSIQSYSQYEICSTSRVFINDYIITGVGGCVITKKMFKESLLNNKDYVHIAPKTDDVWISKILQLSLTEIESCPNALGFVQEIMHQNNALSSQNVYHVAKKNIFMKLLNKIIQKTLAYFGMQKTNNDASIKKVNIHFSKNKIQ